MRQTRTRQFAGNPSSDSNVRFDPLGSPTLAELRSRLKRMRETRETKAEPETKSLSSAEGERIERALGQLTNAVLSISDAIDN